ncbi:magnesium/cobalt transporter CorA [Pseudopedobacter beijingensis]|uniref:Magnesium transport protein CorA n=1 Tax=Pseudopedobacter beijingensis TaxID=1207056 RepID=A0ABW4IGK4_9SPHI
MKKANVPTYKNLRKRKKRIPGESPGTFVVLDNALPSKLRIYAYDEENIAELETSSIEKALAFVNSHPEKFYWLDIQGLGSQEVLNSVQQKFNINALVMEDIVNNHQRPKYEEFSNCIFVVSRVLELDENINLKNEQLSLIVNHNFLITFQEDYEDILNPIRQRLVHKKLGNIRTLGPSYLLYAIMDVATDHNFNLINRLGDELEIIEGILYDKPQKSIMYRIQGVKKIMLTMRRIAWPERDKLNDLYKSSSIFIHPDVKVFLRDVADHNVQIIDLLETYRETSTTMMDIYLSMINNRMNEVMKILTVISAIFIPLTFIAGVYGMNFAVEDPVSGKIMKNNMPELYWENGYFFVWVLMIVITVLQIIYFIKKGWFRD